MKTIRNALLGSCLALPMLAAAGHAQTIVREHGQTITVPPGAVVLIIPAPNATTGLPATATAMSQTAAMLQPQTPAMLQPQTAAMLRMIAQQQADMQQMFAQMNALFPPMPAIPNQSQLFRAAFGAGGPMLTMTAGPGVCSQSVTIVQHGNSAPVITRSESGCGTAASGRPANVRDLPPATATPRQTPELIQAHYAPRTALPAHDMIAER
jgi:hypothetical protein